MTSYFDEKRRYIGVLQHGGSSPDTILEHIESLRDSATVESVLRQLLLDELDSNSHEAAVTYLRRIEIFWSNNIIPARSVFTLIEFMFELIDLVQFEHVFSFMETNCAWLTTLSIPAVVVVRCFNCIIPRLPRTEMATLLGRVRVFSDRITRFGAHSHYASAPQPSTLEWDSQDVLASTEGIKSSFEVYESVWKILNKAHRTHNQPGDKIKDDEWRTIRPEITAFLKQIDETATRVAQIWKLNADFDSQPGRPKASEDHLARDPDANGFFSTNYLTSGRVFEQQMGDPAFRRLVLTELYEFLVFHSNVLATKVEQDAVNQKKEDEAAFALAAAEKEKEQAEKAKEKDSSRRDRGKASNTPTPTPARDRLKEKEREKKELEMKSRSLMRTEIDELVEKTRILIERTPPFGKRYMNMLESVMAREKKWIAWKSAKYAPLWQDLPPWDMQEKLATAGAATETQPSSEDGAPPAKRRKLAEETTEASATAFPVSDFGSANLNAVFNTEYKLSDISEMELLWSEEPEDGEAIGRWKGIRARMELSMITPEMAEAAYSPFAMPLTWRDKLLAEKFAPKKEPIEELKKEDDDKESKNDDDAMVIDSDIQIDESRESASVAAATDESDPAAISIADADVMDVDETNIKMEPKQLPPTPRVEQAAPPKLQPTEPAQRVVAVKPELPATASSPASQTGSPKVPPKLTAKAVAATAAQDSKPGAETPTSNTDTSAPSEKPVERPPQRENPAPKAVDKAQPDKTVAKATEKTSPTENPVAKVPEKPTPAEKPVTKALVSPQVVKRPDDSRPVQSKPDEKRTESTKSRMQDSKFEPVPVPDKPPAVYMRFLGKLNHMIQESASSMEIQKILAPESRDTDAVVPFVYNEVVPEILNLSLDRFANFVVQKLIERARPSMILVIASQLKRHILDLAENAYGTRVLQKLLEKLPDDLRHEYFELSKPFQLRLIFQPNGTHVVLKFIELLSQDDLNWLIDAIVPRFMELGRNNFGCRILQRLIERSQGETRNKFMVLVIDNSSELIQNAFGNYVVQCVVDQNLVETVEAIVISISFDLTSLAKQKFASPALEKILKVANERTLKMICKELFSSNDTLVALVADGYGNFVVQTALEQSHKKSPDEFPRLADAVQRALKSSSRFNPKTVRAIENRLKNLGYHPPRGR